MNKIIRATDNRKTKKEKNFNGQEICKDTINVLLSRAYAGGFMNDSTLNKVGKRLVGKLDGLPQELLDELQIAKTDELEDQILQVLREDYEGVANIDEILVALYKRFDTIQKRAFLSNKLYRMAKATLLKAVEKKKGVYSAV
ncbi:MAG: hypothetical protein ACK5O1_04560 [Holosporales bacterium]